MLKKLSFLLLLAVFGCSNTHATAVTLAGVASGHQQAPKKKRPRTIPKGPAKSTQKTGPTPQQLEAAKYFKEAEDLVGTAAENSDQQIALFQKALELDPNLIAAAFNLGIIYSRLHDPLKALSQFGTVLQKAPADSALSANTHYLAALNLQSLGEVNQAREHLEKALQANPKHADALSLLGNIYFDEGKTDQAKQYMEKAIEANPKLPEAYYRLALMAHKGGKVDEALKYYQKFVELSPNDAGAHLNLAILMAGQDRMEEAFKYAEKATKLEPKNAEAWTELGKIQMLTKRQADAQNSFRRATELDSKWSEAHKFLVTALLQRNKLAEADAILTEAAKNNPKEAEVYSMTGDLAFRMKDPARALQSYGKAHELKPTAETAFDFAMAYAQSGLDPLAEDFFRKAIQLKPDFGEAWYNLALIKDRQKDTAEALTAYRQAESYGIREGTLYYRMGVLYARLKDIEKSLAYLEKAVKADPDRWKQRLREDLKPVTSDLDVVRYRPEFQKLIQ